MKTCPFCAEAIQDAAIKCRHCGSLVDGSATPARASGPSGRPAAARERTIYETGLHWVVYARCVLWLSAALVFAWLDILLLPWVFGVFALFDLGGSVLRRRHTRFTVTSRRLVMTTGVLHTQSVELVLEKVESIGVHEPLIGRLVGYGTVVVGGTGGTKEAFALIPDPQDFRRHVHAQLAARVG